MTGKEFNILDEIRGDVKTLLQFMATSNERVIHCREKFEYLEQEQTRIEKMAEWSRSKILIFSGGVLMAGTIAGLLVKLL